MGSGRKSAFKQALSAAHRHKSSATLARYRIALARLVFEAPSMGAATRDVAAHDVAAHDVASPYILLIEHKVEHRLRVSGDRLQRLGFEGRSGYGWLVGPGAANKFVGMLLYLDVLIDNLGARRTPRYLDLDHPPGLRGRGQHIRERAAEGHYAGKRAVFCVHRLSLGDSARPSTRCGDHFASKTGDY